MHTKVETAPYETGRLLGLGGLVSVVGRGKRVGSRIPSPIDPSDREHDPGRRFAVACNAEMTKPCVLRGRSDTETANSSTDRPFPALSVS